ncbi:MAG: isoprenylcysteine carboxylmethyltransferase family protein [Thermodesulfobacteriota bacterium]
MHVQEDSPSQSSSVIVQQVWKKSVFRLVGFLLFMGAALFLPAYSLTWTEGWWFMGVFAACMVFNLVVLLKVNPELVQIRLGTERGAKPWDKMLAPAVVGLWVVGLVVTGLDYRFGWTPQTGSWPKVVGLALFVVANLTVLWAMSVNKFFAEFVRIQTERGHAPVAAGPYQYVRHPGYAGWILMAVAGPLALGSAWAAIPAACSTALLVVRTGLEDRTLRQELPGYEDYTRRVRYRLVPWLWIT